MLPGHRDQRHARVGPGRGGLFEGGGEFLGVSEYKNLQRWTEAIFSRPAVKRGRMVNRATGEPSEQLRERHDSGDFATKTQDKIAPAG